MPLLDAPWQKTIRDACERFGTPCYVYRPELVRARAQLLRDRYGLPLQYAVKSNPLPPLIRWLATCVDRLDVSSGGEVRLATDCGWAGSDLAFTGPAKSDAELDTALEHAVGHVIVESAAEARALSDRAEAMGRRQPVLLRISGDEPPVGFGVQMAGRPTPFGVDEADVPDAIATIEAAPGLRLDGVHAYPGTQCLDVAALTDHVRRTLELFGRVAETMREPMRCAVLGAGFGVPYHEGDAPLDHDALGPAIRPLLDAFQATHLADGELRLELGRSLVAEAGVYVVRVRRLKHSRGQAIAICDGGLNQNLGACGRLGGLMHRPYRMETLRDHDTAGTESYRVAGALCTSIDTLAVSVDLPTLREGDLIAVGCGGAYGPTASPLHFIAHAPPDEILAWGDERDAAGSADAVQRVQWLGRRSTRSVLADPAGAGGPAGPGADDRADAAEGASSPPTPRDARSAAADAPAGAPGDGAVAPAPHRPSTAAELAAAAAAGAGAGVGTGAGADAGAGAVTTDDASSGGDRPTTVAPVIGRLTMKLAQADTTAPPYWFISGAAGHVLPFQPIARRLATHRTGFGLVYPAFFEEEPPTVTVEAMADRMLPEIKATQPEGPYLLIGYSFGGLVAQELAGRLLRDDAVGIVLVETIVAGCERLRPAYQRAFGRVQAAIRGERSGQPRLTEAKTTTGPFQERLRAVWKATKAARSAHRPRRCPVPTVVMRASEGEYLRRYRIPDDLGWGPLVDVVGQMAVPGDHLNLFKGEFAESFSAELAGALGILESACRRRFGPSDESDASSGDASTGPPHGADGTTDPASGSGTASGSAPASASGSAPSATASRDAASPASPAASR